MKKDHLRDYCTNAFRTYAAAGKPTCVCDASAAVVCEYGALADIIAVIHTLDKLSERRDGDMILKCIELVYFTEPKRELDAGDISARVIAASMAIPADRATIFRKLRIARYEFAVSRGLNVATKMTF